ncbi:enhanced adult sensory threshold isoform X3 [Halictus rubicundus]|uniref:enhanced adult sensory threshold isoform X3 n=1 Tax=Halictus rubicundus TaxID=77578 RepID=UPI0040366C92
MELQEPNVGGSEMASREKKPLAPSKAKQKANNESGLSSNEIKSRKGKTLSNLKQQQLARDILEAVATGSQLPPKLEASLPRKKVLRNLKRKQKLRVAKANLIKSKVPRKVANRNLCRLTSDVKKSVRTKRVKLSEESGAKTFDNNSKVLEQQISDIDFEGTGTETINRSAKNNLRTKKTKFVTKSSEEIENEDTQDKDTDSVAGSSTKNSPKFSRKGKGSDSPDSLTKTVKSTKFSGFKRSNIRDKDVCPKSTEADVKYTKGRKSNNSKDVDCGKVSNVDTKFSKSLLEAKSSIDLTIDEVIASMLSDSEIDSQQGVTEKIEGKVTRSKKMLVEDNIVPDIEIKKDPDREETKSISDGENLGTESIQNAIQLRKRSNTSIGQRSLRNGKLRQSDAGLSSDLDQKRRRTLNSDDPSNFEVMVDNVTDSNLDTESCFSESSGSDPHTVLVAAKDEHSLKQEALKNCDDSSQNGSETENNNNSDRVDRVSEIGPTLRSKTKAKSTEVDVKNDNIKAEYTRIAPKSTDAAQEDVKKVSNLDQVRKDNILAKFADKSKSRRSSLNIDMKKTVNSFYSTDKSDGNPKSQIDQMIENIKLTIAKSIESKIFGPEKGLGLSKNFEVPKIEEIVAPLSTESQKLGLEENTDEEKSAITKNEMKSDSSETNSVPKVADTAKEIEKLVMGDIEPAETHSQNIQESEADENNSVHNNNASESVQVTEKNSTENSSKTVEQSEQPNENSAAIEEPEKCTEQTEDQTTKTLDDAKKTVPVRKSPRISDKGSPECSETKKPSKVVANSKTVHNEESPHEESSKPVSEETALTEEPAKEVSESSKSSAESVPLESSSNDPEEAISQVQESKEDEVKSNEQPVESKPENPSTVPANTEEAETLESISKEVERLVAGDQPSNQQETDTTENVQDKEESSVENTAELSAPQTISSNDTQEAAANSIAEELEKTVEQEKPESTENAKETEASSVVQDTDNCHIPDSPNSSSDSKENTNTDSNDTSISVQDSIQDSVQDIKEEDAESDKCKEDNDVASSPSETVEKSTDKNPEHVESSTVTESPEEKTSNEKATEEQKSAGEEKKRVLRARDKAKKAEKGQTSSSRERNDNSKGKAEEDGTQKKQNDAEEDLAEEKTEAPANVEDPEENQNNGDLEANDLDSKARPRRSREPKKRKDDQSVSQKSKRPKREVRRSDQQNKEETLLDNEVATINENNRSFLNKYSSGAECAGNFRGFSEGGRGSLEKHKNTADSARSKSENDLVIAKEPSKESCEDRLSRNLSENHMTKQTENISMLDEECKPAKTPETSQKDSDETSTSGESSSSVNVAVKILETPEDKAKKESILRLLGLESLEKAAERLNHQKAKKEQYTGTLKTVIRVQKEKERDKRRSRSPLKMVLKQGRGDGEGDSPEFYTIQKEFGTSGLGDSSSDEDNEDVAPKDRQSLVIPEKSSSFSIHPGRLCADVCCYCFGKFGSLDTPMHLAQMKSDERRKKILNIERHLTKDSCLCDACYRHVDRKANTSPTNMQTKPQKQHRQLMVSKCSARDCRDAARHHVKRRWLLKIKAGLQKQVDIDWESSQHTSMSFCVSHYSKIERFLTCALCKRRLARNYTHQLANAETDELNQLLGQQGVPVVLAAGTFVCKLCRYFTQLQLKYKDVENMNMSHRSFFKNYRKRILHYHDIEVLDNEEDELSSQNQSKDKEKRKKSKCPAQSKSGTTKSPDATVNSISEKSTPELAKVEGVISETDNETNRATKANSTNEVIVPGDVQYLGLESTVEKLKKRKLLEMHSYSTGSDATISCDSPNEVVEILAMDKEVTLTRLPKRPRTSNDITPVVQRLGANPSISVRTLFPGEEEMNLHANIEFANVREITPQGWEKCATMIQYDRDTKLLWQELQRPYGNQSSFLRHLILLEKYYRSGDLVLAPNASRNAINYSTSVQNRLISYEGPEKMDEPIMEPIASEYHNSRRLSGGYVLERDRLALPGTSTMKTATTTTASQQSAKGSPSRVLKLNSGVSIIKKPPPNLQRLNLPSTSNATNGNVKRKDGGQKASPASSGSGKVFQMSEPEFKRLQTLKKQKQMLTEKSMGSTGATGATAGTSSSSPPNLKSTQYQKAQQLAAHTQFQKHLRMQQEMLSRQSRGDFEPLICDVRSLANENSPTQNLLHNLNLPKSIQVTTKSSNQIPILPKIPKSLTVIPQTVTRPADK